MSLLKIITYGHPTLRKDAEPVKEITEEIKKLAEDMFDTMEEADGIGLAAPQVNKSIRLIVIALQHIDETMEPTAFINPEIIEKSEATDLMDEGCLSVPGIREDVVRYSKITVKFTNMDGEEEIWEAEDMLARVFQHEMDHLNGVLFTDLISPFKKQLVEGQLENLAKIS